MGVIEMNTELIIKLKEARIAKNLKQSEVADILGVKKNTISNWENGKSNPDIDSLMQLCNIYNISCSALLEESYKNEQSNSLHITGIEKDIILSYRKSDTISKEIVHRALGIQPLKGAFQKMEEIS